MSKHKSILSSLTALGASELPVATNSVPRNGVLASVAAAGVSLLACQSAGAGTFSVFTPNVNVGFAAGDVGTFKLNLASIKSGGLVLGANNGVSRTLSFGVTAGVNSEVKFKDSLGHAAPAVYGKKFSQIGSRTVEHRATIISVNTAAITSGADFSNEYFAFYFLDASSQKHYGWIYGTLTGAYSNLNYNLISYAYDQTPNEQSTTGHTQVSSSTPEPSTSALGAIAALMLGAAGVRKWNKARV